MSHAKLRVRSSLLTLWSLLVTLSLMASPNSAQALESGEGHLGSSYYAVRFLTFGQQFSMSEFYGFMDFRQPLTG